MKLNLKLLISSIISGFLLVSCTSEPVIQTKFIKQQIPLQSRPRPVIMNDVHFYVVTKDNLEEFLKRFEEANGLVVFYAISVKDYENLALNLAEIRRFVKQQGQIIIYYENALTDNK